MPAVSSSAPTPYRSSTGERLLVLGGVTACAAGILTTGVLRELPLTRALEALVIAAIALLVARLLRALRPMSWASAQLAAWLVLAIPMIGPGRMLAAALVAVGALAAGSAVARPRDVALAGIAGAGLLAATIGWSLPVPVHHAWTYAPLLVALVAWRRRHVALHLRVVRRGWRRASAAEPRMATAAVVALGIASTGAWLPALQFDDLAYHLALPSQLAADGRYSLDPSHQAWALAPWSADVLQGLVRVLGGAVSPGAAGLAWLAAAAGALWTLGERLALTVAMRWATLALFGAVPLLTAALGGLQTELPAIAVTASLLATVLQRAPRPRDLVLCGVLGGLLCGLKTVHAFAALGIVLFGAVRLAPLALAHRGALLTALLAAFAVGGSSYVFAAAVAGNPVLPLFNDVFASPYFPRRAFVDPRWLTGFGPLLPWSMTFDTSRYVEGWDGALGFTLVALAGALLLALRTPGTRAATLCAALVLLAPLAVVQYARYALVGAVLLLPPALAALQRALPRREALTLVAALCVLGIAYQANAYWTLHTGAVRRAVLALGQDAPLLRRYAPERLLIAQLQARAPGGAVLDLTGTTHAELGVHGRAATWYSPRIHARATACDRDATGACWARLLVDERIEHAYGRPEGLNGARRAALARVGADPVLMLHGVQWWRIPRTSPR